MKVLYLTREYPPHVYGGAGVHVFNLARQMATLAEVEVRPFGNQSDNPGAGAPHLHGLSGWREALAPADPKLRKALEPISINLAAAALPTDADVVHCHTWYSMLGGLWIKLLYDIPLVITTHSLEPLRPWKEEQLGRGYQLSRWIEQTALQAADAIVAVSEGTRREVLECYPIKTSRVHVVHNGVDLEQFQRRPALEFVRRHGVDPSHPYLLFVGRITRQKGLLHLIRALALAAPGLQAVLCAGEPDTEEIGREVEEAVRQLQKSRPSVFWIQEMLPTEELVALYSGALLFVCPSIYEPFGIINLEAMASECAVVASSVGGIPEVVVNGQTGLLVPFESCGAPNFEPRDPESFARDLAAAINRLATEPELARRMGQAGRQRVEERFSWPSIAAKTLQLYHRLVSANRS